MDTNEKDDSKDEKGFDNKRKLSECADDQSISVKPKLGNHDVEDDQEKYDALPDDVLIRIIEFLPITQWPYLEFVDHKFQRATHGAWRNLRKIRLDEDIAVDYSRKFNRGGLLDFTGHLDEQYLNEKLISILEKLINRAPYLTSITGFSTLYRVQLLNETVVRLLVQFKNLEKLSTFSPRRRIDRQRGISMTVSQLANFLTTSASRDHLKEIDVICRYPPSNNLQQNQHDAQLLRDAFENEENRPILALKRLRIDLGSGTFRDFNFLTTIDVSSMTKLDLLYSHVDSNNLASIIARCTQLEELAFDFVCPADCRGMPALLADQGDPQHSQLITALSNVNNLSILTMGFECSNSICLINCYEDLKSILVDLFKSFGLHGRLTKLSLLDFGNDIIISAIAEYMIHLTSFSFCAKYCRIDPIKRLVKRLVDLKELHIDGDVPFNNDNQMISMLATNLHQLERLYLTCDGEQKTVNLKELIRLENLKELHIFGFDFDLETLMITWKNENNWRLEYLGLPNYREPKNGGDFLLPFIEKMTDLKRLDLSNSKISDSDLEAISIACPNLIELKLSDCNLITTIGIQKIIDGCTHLKRIEVPSKLWDCEAFKMNKYRNFRFGRIVDSRIPVQGETYIDIHEELFLLE